MKTAYIIYQNYLTPDGSGMSVGGIQTYITNLIPLIKEAGYQVHLYQHSINEFEVTKDDVLITGVAFEGKKKNFVKHLKQIVLKEINKNNDLLIFGCETFAFESKDYKSIAIQHGISWDKPNREADTKYKFLKNYVRKCLRAWHTIIRVSKVRQLVCVDYNFVNWYRALTAYPLIRLHVVPNFTEIPTSCPSKPKGKINIIFARRFFEYRGTRIFADAVKPILQKRDDVYITIAGAGPDEQYLKEKLEGFKNVMFTKYSNSDSLAIHADKHIAIVPTLGSEGTSLSLLEAMASGCAVVCTNVGGMTNIVLNEYNGLIISPCVEELYEAITILVNDESIRNRLSVRAYETTSEAFSLNKWQQSWRTIISKA